jgi:glycosyltransferase involved in cell wall biosynthesis
MPSLLDCGGAVVLEAMAMGLPVIATRWGGPADYVDETTGILVAPIAPSALVEGFANAIVKLARSPELRAQMGVAARSRVLERYDWERKIDRILSIYREVQGAAVRGATGR